MNTFHGTLFEKIPVTDLGSRQCPTQAVFAWVGIFGRNAAKIKSRRRPQGAAVGAFQESAEDEN